MRTRWITLLGFAVAAGCGSSVDVPPDNAVTPGGDDGGTTTKPTDTCTAALTIGGAGVVEMRAKLPKLSLTTSDPGGAAGDHPLKVVLTQDGKAIKTLFDKAAALGNVSVDLGGPLAPGAYGIEATLGCPTTATNKTPATARQSLYVVRLGAMNIGVTGDARVPLMYHAVDGVAGSYYPIDDKNAVSSFAIATGESDLDDKDGNARTFPDPWDKLDTPPTDAMGAVMESGATFPVALVAGQKPQITFTLGKTAFFGGKVVPGGVATTGLPDIRLVLDGAPKTEAKITDGGAITFTLDKALAENVGQYDVVLSWHFEAKSASGWVPIEGATQTAKIKVYGVLGNTLGTSVPNLPWVAVVDAATKEIGGKTSDPVEIRKMLVRLVYEDFGLGYDRKSGASAYTNYIGGGSSSWVAARFELGAFLKRSRGSTVNCTDCASILSTYANMIGVRLHYAIIGWNFSLNPILGIGATTAGSPFDSGRMGFSYHAVTTPDSTKTIDDATLALDGDSDPKTAPFTKLLVQDVPGAEYLTRLSPATSPAPEYKYADQQTSVR